jgi:hypothetical protein
MNAIQLQFSEMLERGVIPFLEYELFNDEFLTVEIQATEKGLEFSADFNDLHCFFDGQITGSGNFWLLPYDLDFSLDQHLELIDQNIRDGYIIAHSLDKFEI